MAQKLSKNSIEPAAVCRSCPIGAAHAGKPAPPPAAARRVCLRCGNPAVKIVYDRLCISCYNREREVILGRNRRGREPAHAKPMRPFIVLSLGGMPRRVEIQRVTAGPEGLLSADRICGGDLLLAYAYPEIGSTHA